ncbi:aminotransferase class I/II-fold pyridoxal phosphate-dependent enzyme [Ferruginibacter profundus]
MSKQQHFYDTIDQIAQYGILKGIFHLSTAAAPINGTYITINQQPVVNFGSCSYLGLEFDPQLKDAAKAAIDNYGTQFSASRAYISLGLYNELQELLEKIFEAPCVITPTTTLGHIAAIPVLVASDAAVIMDQQVHNSVQGAVQLLKPHGVTVELVRHNRMDLLEEKISALRAKHKQVWYMADGIYSMFGDSCPIDTIYLLLEKYPELHFYVDDAHGMSIHGKYGKGFVLSRHTIHKKMVMATSLNKAFASGGGVLVFGNARWAQKVGNTGGPLLSSGPMQPSALGAAIASARLHLSAALPALQERLQHNINFTLTMLKKYQLPLVSRAGAAIFFVAVSYPRLGHNVVARMLKKGFYVNLGIFPTVPMRQTGIRFTVTSLHLPAQIESMVKTLGIELLAAMAEEGITLQQVYKAFKLPVPRMHHKPRHAVAAENIVYPEHFKSILLIDRVAWDNLFEGKGIFDWKGLQLLENTFYDNPLPEDNWLFDYLLVKDEAGNIIAATFLTTSLWKEDMLSPASVSAQLEEKRKTDPYYLTSRVICSGCLLTEGPHLYIDYKHPLWKEAIKVMLEKIYSLREHHKASHIMLRDFYGQHHELDSLMVDHGFIKTALPDTHIIPSMNWNSPQEFYDSLSENNRSHIRKKVLRHAPRFGVEVIKVSNWQEEIDHWYQLYLNVKAKSLELNTFTLPAKLFKQLAHNEDWEKLQLTLVNPENDNDSNPCCVVFSYTSKTAYIPVIIGIDYTRNAEFNIYRQALYQLLLQAKKAGKARLLLGFSAGLEKQKIGARPHQVYAYLHSDDSYPMEALAAYAATAKKAGRKQA